MLGRTHTTLNSALWCGGCLVLSPDPWVQATGLVGVALGSLLPDIDEPKSLMGRWVPHLSRLVKGTVGHRTLTHSVWPLFLLSGLAYLSWGRVWFPFVLGLAIGTWLHVLEDKASRSGVVLLWPLVKYNYSKRGLQYAPHHYHGYRVGGPFETVVFILSAACLSVLLVLLGVGVRWEDVRYFIETF